MARADLPALHIRPVRDRPLPSEQEVASAPAASRSRSRVATYRRDRSPLCRLVTLSAFSLLSFAGRIAGIASRLPLGFQGGFPRGPLSEFRIARLLLGLQAGLTAAASASCAAICQYNQPGNIPSGTLSAQIHGGRRPISAPSKKMMNEATLRENCNSATPGNYGGDEPCHPLRNTGNGATLDS
jgi:hypothetical protein